MLFAISCHDRESCIDLSWEQNEVLYRDIFKKKLGQPLLNKINDGMKSKYNKLNVCDIMLHSWLFITRR